MDCHFREWPRVYRRTGRVSFEGAEVSCPNIFFSIVHARKSSGFARILPNFCPKMAI